MDDLKKECVSAVFAYLNFILILTALKYCLLINNFSYILISLMFFIGLLIYELYTRIPNGEIWFFASIILVLFIVFIFIEKNKAYASYIIKDVEGLEDKVLKGNEVEFSSIKVYLWLIVPFAVTLIFFVQKYVTGFFSLLITTTIYIMLWIIGFQSIISPLIFYYILASLLEIVFYVYLKNIKKYKEMGIDIKLKFKGYIVCFLIISLILSCIVEVIPKSFAGLYSSDFENKIAARCEMENDIRNISEKYDLKLSGYDNNDSKLGGRIGSLSSKIALKVKSDDMLYLIGTIKDRYDGAKWTDTMSGIFHPLAGETYNTVLNDNSRNIKSIELYPCGLKTTTIFAPQNALNIGNIKTKTYYDENDSLFNSGNIKNPYKVKFMTPYDLNSKKSIESVEKLENDAKMHLESEAYNYCPDRYLQVPKNMSFRTYELAYQITKGMNDDLKKVLKIRKYLQDNYTYSLNVSDTPKNEEFVDDFLFKKRKGYCVYFATAMAMLSRMSGVPSRYVEGYRMNSEKNSSGLYVVRDSDAHAWTEVYLRDVGAWVQVDSVPGSDEEEVKNDDYTQDTKSVSANVSNNSKSTTVSQAQDNIQTAKKSKVKKIAKMTSYAKLLWNVAILIIIFSAAAVFYMKKKNSIVKGMSVIPLYYYFLSAADSIGYKKDEYKTNHEFEDMILEPELRKSAVEIMNAAESEYFGKKPCSSFDKKYYFESINREMLKARKNIFSKFAWHIQKNIIILLLAIPKQNDL